MENILTMIITVMASVLASSGFWAAIMKRNERKGAKVRMLLGLAHDRIITLGMEYVTRGYILNDEFEDLLEYLYNPYAELGGNGSAERVINEVKRLPIFPTHAVAAQHGFGGQNEEQNGS